MSASTTILSRNSRHAHAGVSAANDVCGTLLSGFARSDLYIFDPGMAAPRGGNFNQSKYQNFKTKIHHSNGGYMSSQQFIVVTKPKPGKEREFDKWYDKEHLVDVVAVPGIVKAKRFRIISQEARNFETPAWYSVALYEIESEDPGAVIAEIGARAGHEGMLISDAIDTEVVLQFLVEPTCEVIKDTH